MRILNLTAGWEFFHPQDRRWYPARVPGCIHTDLQRNGLIPDPFHGNNEKNLQWIEQLDWTYRLTFEASADLLEEEQIELVCNGLDTLATLVLNGQTVGVTENMFCGYRFGARAHLRTGRNTLEVTFASTRPYLLAHQAWQPVKERNDPIGGRSRIRKEQRQFGWDWGPRLVTCGLWRAVRLEAWSGNRLAGARITQHHLGGGVVALSVVPELANPASGGRFRVRCRLGPVVVAQTEGDTEVLTLNIRQAQIWWPAGQGDHPLYHVEVERLDAAGAVAEVWTRRVGLRVVELMREKDSAGESFFFRVNGRALFAKGANWIPDHAFSNECDRARYADRLGSAVAAHMNMLRVWGGGVYEADDFYDLCDELGLLVWQDFMFACALYPGAPEYLELVRTEAHFQVGRLRHHACLALWCGNNEIPMMDILVSELRADRQKAVHYARLFHEVLPQAVTAVDGVTAYWPSSPWTPPELFADANAPGAGDVHYWEVWNALAPVKSYEQLAVRFCSEFGMQSYPSAELAASFCPSEAMNVFSPIMESHQKHGRGNAVILHYMAQRFRYASGYSHLAYLSQLNQAWCMKVGIEHFRHRMPFTMGALYWQLNDCWPVTSWSSIEFGGRWKALQYEAHRFFAPSLVYLRTAGDVEIGRYNTVHNTIDAYEIFTIHDGPAPRAVRLVWSLRTLAGQLVGTEGETDLVLEPGQVVHQASCSLAQAGPDPARNDLYLRAELVGSDGDVLSRQTAFFTVPRFVDLANPRIEVAVRTISNSTIELTLQSRSLAPAVMLGFGSFDVRLSDNWFDLHAGQPHRVIARVPEGADPKHICDALRIISLWDSYQ